MYRKIKKCVEKNKIVCYTVKNKNYKRRHFLMNNNPKRKRRNQGIDPTIFLVLVIVVAIVANIFIFSSLKSEKTPTDRTVPPEVLEDPIPSSDPSSEQGKVIVPAEFSAITLDSDELHFGELVLINGEYAHVADGVHNVTAFETPVDVYANKNKNYSVKDMSIDLNPTVIENLNLMFTDYVAFSGVADVYINAAYRTHEEQQAILEAKGDEIAALPGYSEHHSGYAFDVAVHSGGKYSAISDTGHYTWLPENCKKYGFIRRYPEGKTEITGIVFEPWHYRYVGVPHSYYIMENAITLEEYTKLIKSYTLMGEHLFVEAGDKSYEIYYVPAAEETTEIYVPNDRPYTVSGNNVDGFVVTVENTPLAVTEPEISDENPEALS